MISSPLLYRVEENAAYLIINREQQRNSLNPEVISLFLEYLDAAEKDESVRVILITGVGDKAFCSGADLGGDMGPDGQEAFRKYARLLKRLAGFPKPTVAKVNGYCLAGGMGVMLACDIVVAKDTSRFGTPEVNVGLFPMMVGALVYRNNVRHKKALEMVLLGHKLNALEALDMGLITRVISPEKLDDETSGLIKALAAKSPIGLKIGKEAFYAMSDMPFEEAVDFLSGKLIEVASTEDAVEGITAFLEKRPPVFKGK